MGNPHAWTRKVARVGLSSMVMLVEVFRDHDDGSKTTSSAEFVAA